MIVNESCNLYGAWVEPKYIIPAFMMLLSSGLFPFILHKYKMIREREEKLFDTRKTEYQSYFKTMEAAAKLAGQDYDKFLSETLPAASLKLYQSNSSPESIVEYQRVMQNFTKGINEGFQKATNELVSLRIVCSDSLTELLDQFEGIYHKIMSLQPQMLEELRSTVTLESFITGQFDFDTPSKVKIMELGSELVEVRNQIIKRMRYELGYKN
ncbi:hypothetical protein AO825_20030 [Pectobacterium brasiliense]|uniref:hypothetical protein n=1 Tax=Pectobacterium brasiliense TaxID=180957 RepID=UPI0001A446FD|nr:hypothetical protein [Pectobacterium brasiliense]KGA22313.1 hypothetical protein KS44_19580 [Pectobacterium brasiliense]KRF64939.1 hypothetical protein AO825_20030 [Pectobacterium brasiliense]QHG28368.1 hypothetical protein GT391_10025 [Pectobacterium brasiliense]